MLEEEGCGGWEHSIAMDEIRVPKKVCYSTPERRRKVDRSRLI
jgi:hypothetical protein